MCCNFPTIKITEGNAFTLIFPLKRRSYVAERPIDEDIDVTRLSDVHVTLGGVEYAPTIETYGVRIDVPATLERGTYDGLLTADYDGNAIRGAYESCVQIVAWNAQSNAQQYILGSPVATNAAYVLGYMPTDAEVEALKQELREQIAAAEQAEAEAIAEKQRYAEALENLDDIAQESTLTQGVSDIRNDIANINIEIPTDYAKETTAQQAAADAAAAKTAAQALSPVALAADAYNTGKAQLAANITAKGVQASASENLLQLADKVMLITQDSYEINGGEMFEKQLYGAPTNVQSIAGVYVQAGGSLWNLYEVMALLKSDPRFMNYGGILLAEYTKEYDTIELMNAGAGGAYFTCDGDFYTTDKSSENAHVWHDKENGLMNRWVAYLFAEEGTNYNIINTDLCPQSIYIGRKVGTLICNVEGRIREIVVGDEDELYATNFSSTQVWQKEVKLDVKHNIGGALFKNNTNVVYAILDELEDTVGVLFSNCTNLRSIKITKIKTIPQLTDVFGSKSNLSYIDLQSLQTLKGVNFSFPKANYINLESLKYVNNYSFNGGIGFLNWFSILKKLELPSLTSLSNGNYVHSALSGSSSLEEIYAPLLSDVFCRMDGSTITNNTNLRKITFGKLVSFSNKDKLHNNPFSSCPKLEDIIIGQGVDINLYFWKWDPTTVLSTPEGISQINANIRAHIAANVADGNNMLTFTVSTNLLNNLEQATLDAFAEKHWIVAGA